MEKQQLELFRKDLRRGKGKAASDPHQQKEQQRSSLGKMDQGRALRLDNWRTKKEERSLPARTSKVGGRLLFFKHNWQKLGSEWLDAIMEKGYAIPTMEEPVVPSNLPEFTK